MPELLKWATVAGIENIDSKMDITSEENVKTLISHPRVVQLISSEVENTEMKGFERPKKWIAIAQPFTQDNQMLTPKMSLRRNNILKVYSSLIDDMYSGKGGYEIKQSAQFEI